MNILPPLKVNQKGFIPFLVLLIGAAIGLFVTQIYPKPLASRVVQPTITSLPETQTEVKHKFTQESADKLTKYLTVEAVLLGVPENLSLYFKDLSEKKELSIDPTRSWIPASTVKSFVILEAFKQRDAGTLDFNKQVSIEAQNVVPTELETDEFPVLREGVSASIRQLAEAMVIQSDNTAYNTLLDILGRRNINSTLRNLGITETVVGEKLNLDDEQFAQDLKAAGRQPNTITAKDLASLFDLLYSHKVGSAEEILNIFKRQKINNMIPSLLPPSTQVAHKTGDWAPIYHDGGIVYKPDKPFILTVFTNSNDPQVLARMARVAYYQRNEYVGLEENKAIQTNQAKSNFSKKIILADAPDIKNILGESTSSGGAKITARDLGISLSDIGANNTNAQKINNAFITPRSVFYFIKRFFENIKINNAKNNSEKFEALIQNSLSRQSEIKSAIEKQEIEDLPKLLNDSDNDLKEAISLAKTSQNPDENFLRISLINNLHFSALAQATRRLDPKKKEQFIDIIFNFYQKNKQEIGRVIESSPETDPLSQEPIVGTVTKIDQNSLELQADDGGKKQVSLNKQVTVRGQKSNNFDTNLDKLKVGSRLAILGRTSKEGNILPVFILRDINREVLTKNEGIVVEINPDQHIIKVLNKDGNTQQVSIEDSTDIRSRDTVVSIEGIKVGSVIRFYGEKQDKNIKTTTINILQNSSGKETKFEEIKPKSGGENKQQTNQEDGNSSSGNSSSTSGGSSPGSASSGSTSTATPSPSVSTSTSTSSPTSTPTSGHENSSETPSPTSTPKSNRK